MRNPHIPNIAPRSGLAGWLPGAAAALVALALILASCGSSATPAATGTVSQPAPTAMTQPSAPPVGTSSPAGPIATGSPAAPGSASLAPGTPTSPPAATHAPTPGSAFTLLRMATAANPAMPAPDAKTFVSSFQPKVPVMYVVFALQRGLTGTVVCTITANGVQTAGPITLTYGPTNSWGDFKITSRGIFVTGSYRATLTYGPTGETAAIDFSVQ